MEWMREIAVSGRSFEGANATRKKLPRERHPISNSAALPDKVLDGRLSVLDHRRRGRCSFPFELPGTCMLDLRLATNGS